MPCFTPEDYNDMDKARVESARLPVLFVEALAKRYQSERKIAPEWAANARLIEILLPELCSEVKRLEELGLLEQTSQELQAWTNEHKILDNSKK